MKAKDILYSKKEVLEAHKNVVHIGIYRKKDNMIMGYLPNQ